MMTQMLARTQVFEQAPMVKFFAAELAGKLAVLGNPYPA
jgi:hypothetical protein